MSRDWTPREQLAAEAILEGRTWLDVSRGMTITYNGTEKPMCPAEYCDFLEQFNYFKRVGYDAVFPLYKKYGDSCIETMRDLEHGLAHYITTGEPIIPWLRDWFEGELDEGFYYRERNDELFREYAEKEIESYLSQKAQTVTNNGLETSLDNGQEPAPMKRRGR